MTTTPPREQLPTLPEPEAYLFQHEETGITQFVDGQQVEWGFEKNNPRLQKIGGVYTESQMQAYAREALRAQAASVVPVGWKLVPIEATRAMVDAAIREADRQETLWAYDGAAFWLAMLTASPAPAHIPADVSPPQAPQAVGSDKSNVQLLRLIAEPLRTLADAAIGPMGGVANTQPLVDEIERAIMCAALATKGANHG